MLGTVTGKDWVTIKARSRQDQGKIRVKIRVRVRFDVRA
jgi:hypothetical protein